MRTWCVIVLTIYACARVSAQEAGPGAEKAATSDSRPETGLVERLGVTGSLRAGYWSSTRTVDDDRHLGAGMVWLKTTRRLAPQLSVTVDGWTAMTTPGADGTVAGELREAFVTARVGHLDVRAGRQIIAWGRADGLNPTDNLSGQDLTLLVPDDIDRRLGVTALRASYYAGDVSLTAIWLPEFRGHEFPLPAPPPGTTFARTFKRWPVGQWAARVEQTGRAVDWSLSYLDGRDLTPDLGVATGVAGAQAVTLSHHRIRVWGADVAATLGRYGLRGEAASVRTDDPVRRDPFTKNPFVFIVVGADRTFGGRLNLNVQYLFRRVANDSVRDESGDEFAEAVAVQQAVLNSQTRRLQQGASLRVAYKWLHDTLDAECALVGYAGPAGGAVRPKVAYAVTDAWKLVAGAEITRGEMASVFGLLSRNSTGYLELRWGF